MLAKLLKVMKKITPKNLLDLFLATLIFTIPSNLFKIFGENTAFVRGLRVDYLIPKIHFSDIILITIFLLVILIKENRNILINSIKNIENKFAVFTLLVVLIIFQTTIKHPLISLMFLARVGFLFCISTVVFTHKNILKSQTVLTAISITAIFQSLLAWYQYLNQKSFFGYHFLGETNLNSYAGIAQSSLFGLEQILPYGTTAHPNILGGILAIFFLILYNHRPKNGKIRRIGNLILMLILSVILLTQSVSALLGVAIGLFTIILIKKLKVSFNLKKLLLIFITFSFAVVFYLSTVAVSDWKNVTSISRRQYLNIAAISMIKDHPIFGVGLQNFTDNLEKYSDNQEVVRFIQPVHNALLLIISESGILGLTLLLIFFYPQFRKNRVVKHPEYFLALLPIINLDHYLISIQTGILLLFLVIWQSDYS
jgi:O-antigen ligase